MLSFGNKDFRNLQEQVLKNMSDIQDMMQGVNVLADFGIKVVGQVDSAADLPDPSEYEGDYGDAYVVGESEPYDYYIFTRAFEGEEEPQWFDLGQFPVPGPQGETGPQGEIGETPNVAMEIGSVSTLLPSQDATASIVKSGTLSDPVFTLNLAIPQGFRGMMGLTGPQGPRGPQGPQGEKGEKGEQGGLIEIVGIVAAASALPSPTTLQKLDAAYLVGTSPDYELYVQVGESPSTALWTNLGAINEGTVVTVNGEPQTVWEASGQFVPIYDGQLVDTLYGQAAGTGNGQTHVPYGNAATANYIVQRDINAQIEVPQTPTANAHAASKKYVDDTVAAVLPTQYAGDLIVGTSTAHQATRLAIGSANQVLSVNSSGNGLEYKTINSVPSYTSSDADKALKVNSLGTALEWGTVSSGGGGAFTNIINSNSNNEMPSLFIGGKNATDKIKTGTFNNTSVSGLYIDTYGSTSTLTQYTVNDMSGGAVHVPSILMGNMTDRGGYLPSARGSIMLVGQFYYPCPKQVIYSILLSDSLDTYSYKNSDSIFENSILLGSSIAGGRSGKASTFANCVMVGTSSLPTNAYNFRGIISSLYNWPSWSYASGVTVNSFEDSIILNNNTLYNSSFTINGVNSNTISDIVSIGAGHLITYNKTPITIIGKFGVNEESTDRFVVGCGTSTTARANCFTTGKDANDAYYIKIGSTKITEAQLQALLATL